MKKLGKNEVYIYKNNSVDSIERNSDKAQKVLILHKTK
jgi:hypothetical protein